MTETKKKAKAMNLLRVAENVHDQVGLCVFQGEEFYKYHKTAKIWYGFTKEMKNAVAVASGGQHVDRVLALLQAKYDLPVLRGVSPTPFFQWQEGDWINGGWKPKVFSRNDLVFANGTLNLLTGEIKEHEGIWGPTIDVDVNTLPDIRNGNPWPERFKSLMDSMENALEPEWLACFQQSMSFIIRPHVHFRHGIFVVGEGGSRKSTVVTALCYAPGGQDGVTRISERRLGKDERFASSGLVGRFVNFSDDQGGTQEYRDWFKSYTGNNTFQGEFKYANSRTYSATAKLVSCCNQLPKLADGSDAIKSRMLVFAFSKKTPGVAEPEYITLSPHLDADYWMEPATRAHIISWMVEGARKVAQSGDRIDKPKAMMDELTRHIDTSDPVRAWLAEKLVVEGLPDDEFTSTSAILQAMQENGVVCSAVDLATYLRQFGKKSIRKRIGEMNPHGYNVRFAVNRSEPDGGNLVTPNEQSK